MGEQRRDFCLVEDWLDIKLDITNGEFGAKSLTRRVLSRIRTTTLHVRSVRLSIMGQNPLTVLRGVGRKLRRARERREVGLSLDREAGRSIGRA